MRIDYFRMVVQPTGFEGQDSLVFSVDIHVSPPLPNGDSIITTQHVIERDDFEDNLAHLFRKAEQGLRKFLTIEPMPPAPPKMRTK